MSRLGLLKEATQKLGDIKVRTITGTPADCANIGIYYRDGEKPDCLISGVNIGHNSGIAYVLSSGTVGAALEANIAGIPALSLSQLMPSETYMEWYENRGFSDETMNFYREQFHKILPRLWEAFLPNIHNRDPLTWNVNCPIELASDWELKPARCGLSYYSSCFASEEGGYRHAAPRPLKDERPDADNQVMASGHVSVTELDIRTIGQFVDASDQL